MFANERNKRRGKGDPLNWLQALVDEIAALADDWCLLPFEVVATALACDVLSSMSVPHRPHRVGLNVLGGTPRNTLHDWEAIPTTDATTQDWFRRGGTYQSAGYGDKEGTNTPPYLILDVKGKYLLDLSAVRRVCLDSGDPVPPLACDLNGPLAADWRWAAVDVASMPMLIYENFGDHGLAGDDGVLGDPDARLETLAALWKALEWYGWPVELAGRQGRKEDARV